MSAVWIRASGAVLGGSGCGDAERVPAAAHGLGGQASLTDGCPGRRNVWKTSVDGQFFGVVDEIVDW